MGRTFANLPGYEIISRIGKGAGAVIYEARASATRQVVTLKHVVRHGPDEDRFVAQAENEHEVARGLEHPNLRKSLEIVRVRRWLKLAELFLILEHVAGETLENRRKAAARPGEPLDELLDVFIQIAAGLQALHKQGFAHADIKPNNVILTDGGVKLIDFGQSCPLGHRKERVQGTPDYMAPEQVLRHPIDHRTDVFNLGATMYWVTTGKWFRTMMSSAPAGSRRIELESRVGNDPPHTVNPGLPLPLSQLIQDCCETEPRQRPRDMSAVVYRLELVKMHLGKKRKNDAASGSERSA